MLRKAPSHRFIPAWLMLGYCLIFCLVTALLYWPGLYGPFLLDDLQSIIPSQITHFSWTKLLSVSLQNQTGPLGRPLSVCTLALNGLIFGSDPFYFKAINLGLHILCGLAVGLFVYSIIQFLPKHRNTAQATALLTMMVWLIHPLQLSTVLYVVQRMTQLGTLFTLLALNLYLYGRLRQITHQRYWLLPILLSFFVFFPLAVLSKETGLLFPWYLFCIEYFILRFNCPEPHQRYKLIHFHRILSLSLILGALLYFYYKLPYYFSIYQEKDFTLISRLLTEAKALVFYLSLILRPMLSTMGLYHDDFPISISLDNQVIIAVTLLISMLGCIIFCRKRAPIIAFGLAWFFISHLIESTLLPLENVFEHRNYLALLGIVLIPCYYLVYFARTRAGLAKYLASIGIFMMILLLSSLTLLRAIGWSSTLNFINESNIYHPRSARTHIELSNLLLNQKQYSLAIEELNKALVLQPGNIGIVLHKILIGCQAPVVAAKDYQIAANEIRYAAITPYTIMVLDQLVKNIFEKQCLYVNQVQIEHIIENALNNRFLIHRPLYKAVLYNLQAGLALSNKNLNQCLALLMKSYEAYPQRIDPLIQKATIEWQHQLYKESLETRALIEKRAHSLKIPYDKVQQLDQLLRSRE